MRKNIAIILGLISISSSSVYAELLADKAITNQTNQAVNIYWGPEYKSVVNIQDKASGKVPATQVLVGLQSAYQSWVGNITQDCTLKVKFSNPKNPEQPTSVTCGEASFKCDPKYSCTCPAV